MVYSIAEDVTLSAKWDDQFTHPLDSAGTAPAWKFSQAVDRLCEDGADALGGARTHRRQKKGQSLEVGQRLRQEPDLVSQRRLSR